MTETRPGVHRFFVFLRQSWSDSAPLKHCFLLKTDKEFVIKNLVLASKCNWKLYLKIFSTHEITSTLGGSGVNPTVF